MAFFEFQVSDRHIVENQVTESQVTDCSTKCPNQPTKPNQATHQQ
jgi:hypothetical protein